MDKVSYVDNEPAFRWALLQDQMASDKLEAGIRGFAADAETLKTIIEGKVSEQITQTCLLPLTLSMLQLN